MKHSQKIDRLAVSHTIWFLLPVAIISTILVAILSGGVTIEGIFIVPFVILTYGAFIWVPTILLVYLAERIFIRSDSEERQILTVFGVETLLTFLILLFVFRDGGGWIAVLGLVMSLLTQFTRWRYLKKRNKLYIIGPDGRDETVLDNDY